MKNNYYKLSGSVEPAISGIKEITQLHDFIDPKNTNPTRMALYQEYSGREFLSEEKYDLQKFKMRDNAKPTNIITTAFLDRGGLFVSEKLKQIIEVHELCKTSFYETHITQKSDLHLYYYMNTLNTVELINFEQSEFVYDSIIRSNKLNNGQPVSVADYETFVRLKRESSALRSGQTLFPKKIVLKKHYDLLREPLGVSVLISENLKNKIKDAGIEDVNIEDVKYEI